MASRMREVPPGFAFDKEHPVVPIPFRAWIGDRRFEGRGLSVAAAQVTLDAPPDPALLNSRHVARLAFDFEDFSISLYPEIAVGEGAGPGELTLRFLEPTGPHLPQLRYILNSFIAGDFVSLGAMMAYSGPTRPKDPKAKDGGKSRRYLRSIAAIGLSLALIAAAGQTLLQRYTQSYEARPAFINRAGNDMRATSAGQITYLNTAAGAGEVVYSISANSGDVLNFQLPCDCEVSVVDGIFEGATVLPGDPILSIFDSSVNVRVESLMSVEGVSKAMGGEQVLLDLSDGRSVPVRVLLSAATDAAAARGDLYLPVTMVAESGDFDVDDIGKTARIRLVRPVFGGSLAWPGGQQ
ncbi:hypothetical protein GE300_04240 [Rhodobacteraceae bacterium 2CG4]|uniref:HlyD family secretion protein n=1 Tax=Halovulum marinum TaxID=2662447 RepID=A0A6L5YWX7_9RHOB|nr:hypothetical protein [Halovulum marinum]MSU88831.1 hypothetical protein [Halovulum marinum]